MRVTTTGVLALSCLVFVLWATSGAVEAAELDVEAELAGQAETDEPATADDPRETGDDVATSESEDESEATEQLGEDAEPVVERHKEAVDTVEDSVEAADRIVTEVVGEAGPNDASETSDGAADEGLAAGEASISDMTHTATTATPESADQASESLEHLAAAVDSTKRVVAELEDELTAVDSETVVAKGIRTVAALTDGVVDAGSGIVAPPDGLDAEASERDHEHGLVTGGWEAASEDDPVAALEGEAREGGPPDASRASTSESMTHDFIAPSRKFFAVPDDHAASTPGWESAASKSGATADSTGQGSPGIASGLLGLPPLVLLGFLVPEEHQRHSIVDGSLSLPG